MKAQLYEKITYDYFTWLIRIIKVLFPKHIVNTTQIGLAMINTVLFGYDKKILDPNDIQILSASKKTIRILNKNGLISEKFIS